MNLSPIILNIIKIEICKEYKMKTSIKMFFILIMILLVITSCTNNKEKVVKNEKIVGIQDVLGFWDTVSEYDAENIEFQKEDGGNLIYYSYLNSRPYSSGKWSFKNGTLKLESESGDIFTYIRVEIEGDLLKITDSNGNVSVFKRPPKKILEKDEILINLKVYLNKISAFTGLDNSEPIKTEFNWNFKGGKTIEVSGLSTKCPLKEIAKDDFQSMNEKVKDIGDYLSGLEFSQNVFNTTEIQSAYSGDSYVFTITIDTKSQTNSIIIKVGKLKQLRVEN